MLYDVNTAPLWDLGATKKVSVSLPYSISSQADRSVRIGNRIPLLTYLRQRFSNSFQIVFASQSIYNGSMDDSTTQVDDWHQDGWRFFDPIGTVSHDFWLLIWSNMDPTELQDPNEPDTVYTTEKNHLYLLKNDLWKHRRIGRNYDRRFARAFIVETERN